MNKLFVIFLALSVIATPAAAGEVDGFTALRNIQDAVMLSNEELSNIEATALFYGTIRIPVYFESISAFMNEVLATLLRIDGRSPIVTYKMSHPVFAPLPSGGITVGAQSHRYILLRTFICMICTRL